MSKRKVHGRLNIIKEIIETEEIYLSNLEALEIAYAAPLRENINSSKNPLLKKEDYQKVFGELTVIKNVNSNLLKELKKFVEEDKSGKKPTFTVGEIFLRFAPFLKSYSSYLNNYERTSELLRKRQEESKEFREFLLQCKRSKESKNYDIFSILIMPGIPRYELLLRDLMSQTSECHRDYENLKKGLAEIHKVAEHVDKKIHDFEKRAKLREIADKIFNNDVPIVEPWREFISEENVTVLYGKDKEASRRMFMFNDSLVLCKEKSGEFKFKNFIKLDTTPFPWINDLEDTEKIKNGIQLVTEYEVFTLLAETPEKKQQIVDQLIEILLLIAKKNPEIIKNRAKFKRNTQNEQLNRRKSKNRFSFVKQEPEEGETLIRDFFPKRGEEPLVTQEQIEEVKKKDYEESISICRARFSFLDEQVKYSDELLFENGDIFLVYDKNLGNNKYWLVRKAGLNCIKPPPQMETLPEDYAEFQRLMRKNLKPEELKKIIKKTSFHFIKSANVQPVEEVESPDGDEKSKSRLSVLKMVKKKANSEKKDEFGQQFFDDIQNKYDQAGQVGVIPSKFLMEFPDDVGKKLIKKMEKRDDEENAKIRNFKIKKKKSSNALLTVEPPKKEEEPSWMRRIKLEKQRKSAMLSGGNLPDSTSKENSTQSPNPNTVEQKKKKRLTIFNSIIKKK